MDWTLDGQEFHDWRGWLRAHETLMAYDVRLTQEDWDAVIPFISAFQVVQADRQTPAMFWFEGRRYGVKGF